VKMSKEIIPLERLVQSIRWIRGQKVLLDSDLAALYGVQTKNLNKAVKRNAERFPADFMFQLTPEELRSLRFHFGTSNARGGLPYRPDAFREQEVAMLSSGLNGDGFGERTRPACWRWRPRHRELFLRPLGSVFCMSSGSHFSARRRKEHAGRMCSPE
jgi:ORF6N domain